MTRPERRRVDDHLRPTVRRLAAAYGALSEPGLDPASVEIQVEEVESELPWYDFDRCLYLQDVALRWASLRRVREERR